MQGTPRLYFEDPLLDRFTTRVSAHAAWNGRPALVLERTAFYPEAGGQMADRGTLGGAAVLDVQVDDAGVVHHVIDGELPAVGVELDGVIDRARRRVHMALHTGQHMLSRALMDEARGETVSSRLGETACTIDLDIAEADERSLARAEALCNSVIDDDVAIRAWFPAPAELAALPLRRTPKVSEDVRVIEIGAFDVSPCGGTHCLRSGQVGLVKITGVERYKGKQRITFVAGRRAREQLWSESGVLRAMARDMTCGPAEVPAGLDKLRTDLSAAQTALGQVRTKIALRAADELLAAARARGESSVIATFDDGDVELLRAVAKRLTAEPDVIALLAVRDSDGQKVLVTRGERAAIDCGALLKRAAAACGGRGGGGKERAEGKIPADADWAAIARAALSS